MGFVLKWQKKSSIKENKSWIFQSSFLILRILSMCFTVLLYQVYLNWAGGVTSTTITLLVSAQR